MNQVKFIQLTATTAEDYQAKIEQTLQSCPGAIIFVANNGKGKQEIWANGLKYEVGGGGGNVIYGTDMINTEGKTYKWKTDKNGDFVIDEETKQRVPEYTNITGSEGSIYVYTGEKTQTAYYWVTTATGGRWEPFNVDAENVWFPNGFRRTEAWGVIGATGGTVENDIKPGVGESPKNLILVFEHYLVRPAFPSNVRVTCANPSPTFTAKYTNSTPVTISATNDSDNLSDGSYVLAGTNISLHATYKYNIQVDEHETSLVFGPMTISGMEYGYTALDSSDNEIKSEDTTITGAPVTITSTLGNLLGGTVAFDITKSGTSVGTNTLDTADSASKQNTCTRSDALQLGDNVYTATGSTTDKLTRTLSPAISDNQVEVSPISYTNVKYWNNKKDEQRSVPTGDINPYNNKNLSVNYSTTAGVREATNEITIKGYLPIYYGFIDSQTVSITSLNTLDSKTGSNGYVGGQKQVTLTPNSNLNSSVVMPYIVIPSTCSIFSVKYGTYSLNVSKDNEKLSVKNGGDTDVPYTSYLIKDSWAYGAGQKFTITFKNN